MLQIDSSIPHFLSQNWPVVAGILAIASFISGWFSRRKKEPFELSKLRAETFKLYAEARGVDADTRSTDANTNAMLLGAACEALTNAARLLDERNHWERKAHDLEQRLAKAEDDAETARLFTRQLHAAARLTTCEHHPRGVQLSDHLPQQLNSPKDK